MDIKEPYIRSGYRGETVIDLPPNKANEIIAWCYSIFGESGNSHRYLWRVNHVTRTRIFLRNEKQVLLFKLKWL